MLASLFSITGLLVTAFVGAVTLLVALATEIGPIVVVLSDTYGVGVHVGDLAAMMGSFLVAMAVLNAGPLTRTPIAQAPAVA